jgi:putative transposase
MRYIEMNPVRAGICAKPSGYAWSSHDDNASGKPHPPLTAHAQYLELGSDQRSRAAAYKALFEKPLQASELDAIRASLAKNRVLGSERFIADLGFSLDRQVGIRSRGRPRKRGQEKMSPDPI